MCGIVGYVGTEEAQDILLRGLKTLEYRGYDSVGVSIKSDDGIKLCKMSGRVAGLESYLEKNRISGLIGIGHTRWATHGGVSQMNSHPHASFSKKIHIVHNGIIENYADLKVFLQGKGFYFESETDSEVIAHLLEYYCCDNFFDGLIESLRHLTGVFAFAAMFGEEIYIAKKGSPIVVGHGLQEYIFSSDLSGLSGRARDVVFLEDGEIAVLRSSSCDFFSFSGEKIDKQFMEVNFDSSESLLEGYPHYMVKEIFQQAEVLERIIQNYIDKNSIAFSFMNPGCFSELKKIYIVACGTAYHAGLVGKSIIEGYSRISVEVVVASEFINNDPILEGNTLCILISQSGETMDTLFALRKAKSLGIYTLAIVNSRFSTISREADEVLYSLAGVEIAVASTKAYISQIGVLYLFAAYLSGYKRDLSEFLDTFRQLPRVLRETFCLDSQIEGLAERFSSKNKVFFIGRGLDYASAVEASLKLKEVSYISSEAYPAGELKHGTIALIDDQTLTIAISSQESLNSKMISNAKEVQARGGDVLFLGKSSSHDDFSTFETLILPEFDSMFAPFVTIVPLQLFAYYTSLKLGLDVDKPRNLAKSVTVE
ncbi:MAG: glutamine--fructose-6-phosphate transaminase (isomerizing) [Spirochaetales bacterium]|nr:glutamine--fructose-6-phosphate transaminase (isomerizing) [Spirochaetales bacterium]